MSAKPDKYSSCGGPSINDVHKNIGFIPPSFHACTSFHYDRVLLGPLSLTSFMDGSQAAAVKGVLHGERARQGREEEKDGVES